jgi:hypothetical protein
MLVPYYGIAVALLVAAVWVHFVAPEGAMNWPGESSDLYTRMEPPYQANTNPNFVSVRSACSLTLAPSMSH